MRYAGCAIVGILAVLSPVALRAQTIPSHYQYIETRHSVGLFGGRMSTDAGSMDLGPESADIFGARYDIHLTGPLSGELSIATGSSTRTVYALDTENAANPFDPVGEADVRMLIGEAGFRFRLTGPRTWRGISPFAVASAGFVTDLEGSPAIEGEIPSEQRFSFGPSFAASGGLGSDFFLTEHFSLRVEARDHLWRLTSPAGFNESGSEEHEWVQNFGFTLGGTVHF